MCETEAVPGSDQNADPEITEKARKQTDRFATTPKSVGISPVKELVEAAFRVSLLMSVERGGLGSGKPNVKTALLTTGYWQRADFVGPVPTHVVDLKFVA